MESSEAVYQEVAAPEPEASQPGEQQAPQQIVSEQDKNWREARRSMEAMQQEIAALRAERDEWNRQRQQPPEEEISLSDDDWVTGRDIKKYADKLVAKKLSEELPKVLQKQQDANFEYQLKRDYADYENVVSPEAVEQLQKNDPTFCTLIKKANVSNYEKGVAVYNYLKGRATPNLVAEENRRKAEANMAKPKSLDSSSRHGVLSQIEAFGGQLTPELQKQLYEEMCRYAG